MIDVFSYYTAQLTKQGALPDSAELTTDHLQQLQRVCGQDVRYIIQETTEPRRSERLMMGTNTCDLQERAERIYTTIRDLLI